MDTEEDLLDLSISEEATDDRSLSLLENIERELSSIRSELGDLKRELGELRGLPAGTGLPPAEAADEEAVGFFEESVRQLSYGGGLVAVDNHGFPKLV